MYILLINIHGLVRSKNVEFGRDADTGGQTRYVLDLARALGRSSEVDKVDLITRSIRDKTVSSDYSESEEPIEGSARIVRLSAGGSRYIRKENLWPTLDEFTDRTISYLRRQDHLPDVIHGHYADSGYVAEHVAATFGIPLVFTAHSLGRNKLCFLESQGWSEQKAHERYSIKTRIEQEENILSRADLVIASTSYEKTDLYGLYNNRNLPRYAIMPPGLDLDSFFPYYDYELPGSTISDVQKQAHMRMRQELRRFHFEPDKPLILTLCRPDARKNIDRLIEVYGKDKELQAMANLAIFVGIRDDISKMEDGEQQVLTDILLAMDRYDLYGKMAIPKNHDPTTDVPEMYRIAALSKGIFVSASYLETFGLTFVEASATGLPFVATDKGGPVDIAGNCHSGRLVNIEDIDDIAGTMKKMLTDSEEWTELSEHGINQTRKIYSWENHVRLYLDAINDFPTPKTTHGSSEVNEPAGKRFGKLKALLVVDIDDTLIGDDAATQRICSWIDEHQEDIGFCVATGRDLDSAVSVLKEKGVPAPDLWISSVGSELYYGSDVKMDKGWSSHINRYWRPNAILEILNDIPFLEMQNAKGAQREFKLSYSIKGEYPAKEALPRIHSALTRKKLHYNLVFSHGRFVDILPYRASKGKAIRYVSTKWYIAMSSIITAGNSGNDKDMLTGSLKGIVVANHEIELDSLKKTPNLYFAKKSYADGILEGIDKYRPRQ